MYWYLRYRKKSRKTKKRKWWVHPFIATNQKNRMFIAAKELDKHPVKFKLFYRMSKKLFLELVEKVRPHVEKKDTNFRKSVSVEERLLITLR